MGPIQSDQNIRASSQIGSSTPRKISPRILQQTQFFEEKILEQSPRSISSPRSLDTPRSLDLSLSDPDSSSSGISPRVVRQVSFAAFPTLVGPLKFSRMTSRSSSDIAAISPRRGGLPRISDSKTEEKYNQRLKRKIHKKIREMKQGKSPPSVKLSSWKIMFHETFLDKIDEVLNDYIDRKCVFPPIETLVQMVIDKVLSYPLLDPFLSRIEFALQCVEKFRDKEKETTQWGDKFFLLLRNLVRLQNSVKGFFDEVNHPDITGDPDIQKMLKVIFRSNIHKAMDHIRQFMQFQNEYREILQGRLRGYEEVRKITQRCWSFEESEDALETIQYINLERTLELFSSHPQFRVHSIKLNDVTIERDPENSDDRFLREFLEVYNQVKFPHEKAKEWKTLVPLLKCGKWVAPQPLLWLCVYPFNFFTDEIKNRFPNLFYGMEMQIKNDRTYLEVTLEESGEGQLKTEITYECRIDQHPIGTVSFIMSLAFVESQPARWVGEISIGEMVVHKTSSSHNRWKFYEGVMNPLSYDPSKVILELEEIKGLKERKQFDESFFRFISNLTLISVKQQLSSKIGLQWLIKNYCRSLMNSRTCKEPPDRALATEVWNDIHCTDIVLRPLISRLQLLENKIIRFLSQQRHQTDFAAKIVLLIRLLICSDRYAGYGESTPQIASMLKILENDFHHFEEVKIQILRIMCGGQHHVEPVLDFLRTLSNPMFVGEVILPVLLEIYSEKLVPVSFLYEWVEPLDRPIGKRIRDIDVSQVNRCLHRDGNALFHKLSVNDQVIDPQQSEIDYYKSLLRSIYQSFSPSLGDKAIEALSQALINNESIDCMPLLQLTAVSNRLIGDLLVRKMFPLLDNLFMKLHYKIKEHLDCHLVIESASNYSVRHTLAYDIYPRIEPDSQLMTMDKSRLLATCLFYWTLSPTTVEGSESIKGRLEVKEITLFDKIANSEEAYLIDKAFKQPFGVELAKGWEFVPTTVAPISPLSVSRAASSSAF